MLKFPANWKKIGQPIDYKQIQSTLIDVLQCIGCRNLSLSGGLDSTYMLYCMVEAFDTNINTYTVVGGKNHPDYIYSKMAVEYFGVHWNPIVLTLDGRLDPGGNNVIRYFYTYLKSYGVENILACDGIDEFMCGYYAHQKDLTEETYFKILNELVMKHLIPLDQNSGDINVHLPYLDEKLITLYMQIPFCEKVNIKARKCIMKKLARGNIPDEIIERRKYGFCDAGLINPKKD